MTESNPTIADAASEARGASPAYGSTGADMTETRPAFNFSEQQNDSGNAGSAPATLKDKALTRLQGEADNRKSMVSDQLKQVSGALAAVGGGETGGEAPQWLSKGVSQATQFIDRIAEAVETRNSAELVDDVRSFARANPALFLGAAALAGFAAVRVFSATSSGR